VLVFIRSIPLFAVKPENLANRFGNHEFFIGADYADRYPASRHKRLAFASAEILLGSQFLDPVSLAIVMSMQSDLVLPG
jgi:hypothetical protein